MSSSQELIGLGLPGKQAASIGNLVSAKNGVGLVQAGAAPITTNFTILIATAGQTAFILPPSAFGAGPFIVVNQSGTPANIFPPVGNSIQGLGTNAAFPVVDNKTVMFFKVSALLWAAILTA
jgi:hypothetical protein